MDKNKQRTLKIPKPNICWYCLDKINEPDEVVIVVFGKQGELAYYYHARCWHERESGNRWA